MTVMVVIAALIVVMEKPMDVQIQMHVTMMPMRQWMMVAAQNMMNAVNVAAAV
jgi:hypothetical protein